MNHLQQNVANSFTLDQGSYDIKITSGIYNMPKLKQQENLLFYSGSMELMAVHLLIKTLDLRPAQPGQH
jgi:hypothetical protein